MFMDEIEMLDRTMATDSAFSRQARRTGKPQSYGNIQREAEFNNPEMWQRHVTGESLAARLNRRNRVKAKPE